MPRPTLALLPALDGVVLTAAGVEAFDCPVCAAPRDLVVPFCDDDDDRCEPADLPDRMCAVCGLALSLGPATPEPPLEIPLTRRAG
ncbi:hypothetical protein ACXR2U_11130 [Jatrophihabitans sp. YIM 134969]